MLNLFQVLIVYLRKHIPPCLTLWTPKIAEHILSCSKIRFLELIHERVSRRGSSAVFDKPESYMFVDLPAETLSPPMTVAMWFKARRTDLDANRTLWAFSSDSETFYNNSLWCESGPRSPPGVY